jgi:hypothetical protein
MKSVLPLSIFIPLIVCGIAAAHHEPKAVPIPTPKPKIVHHEKEAPPVADPEACGTKESIVENMMHGPLGPVVLREFGKGRFAEWLVAVRRSSGDRLVYEPSSSLSFIITSERYPYLEIYPVGMFTTSHGEVKPLACTKYIYKNGPAMEVYRWLTSDTDESEDT